MATQQELLNQASEIRDAELEGENTAVRVGTMLINLIEYLSNFVSTDVLANYVTAAALDAATVGMQTSLNKKADIILMSNTRKLRIDEWPLVSLYSTELVQDTDAPENKMWWSAENSKLKYKHAGVVYEIGDPAYTLYYCGYKIFKWTGSGFAEMKVSVINNLTTGGVDTPLSAEQGKILKVLIDNEILARSNGDSAIAGEISSLQSAINEETSARQSAINEEASARQSADNQKTDKDQYTSKLTYSQAPDVVLASMGATLDNAGNTGNQQAVYIPRVGDTYWDSTSGHVKFKASASTTHDLGEPNPGLVYCNKRTDLTYRWAGSSGWEQVGGAPSSAVTVVNDLTTGGGDKALSAEMGKLLKANIVSLFNSLSTLYAKLGNIAFWSAQDKADAAPTALDWNVPKKALTITNNLSNSVISYNGEPVSGSILVDAGETIDLLVSGASGYVVTSVTASGATVIDNQNDTFTVRVKVDDDMTLTITGFAVVVVVVGITTSNQAGALGLSNSSAHQNGTFVGQITYVDDYYNKFEITSVKDTSNNDVSYTLNGNEITIANVPSDITITAVAKKQLKVWFGKTLNFWGGLANAEGECVTDYIRMDGLTSSVKGSWNNGGLSKLGDFPLMNNGRCLILYDSDKRLLYADGGYEILRVPSYISTTSNNPRDVSTAWLSNMFTAAGVKTPLYARFTAKCTGTTISSSAGFTQNGVQYFDKSDYAATSDAITQHNLSYSLSNAEVDNEQSAPIFPHNQPIEVSFKGATGYDINNATIVVTMGGNTLTAGTDYTVTSTTKSGTNWKTIRIENVTGDVNFNVSIS